MTKIEQHILINENQITRLKKLRHWYREVSPNRSYEMTRCCDVILNSLRTHLDEAWNKHYEAFYNFCAAKGEFTDDEKQVTTNYFNALEIITKRVAPEREYYETIDIDREMSIFETNYNKNWKKFGRYKTWDNPRISLNDLDMFFLGFSFNA